MTPTAQAEIKKYYTPGEIAERYAVGVGRVIGWIRRGELVGLNVSGTTGGPKPQFRVTAAALEQFEAARAVQPPPKKRPRRRPYKKYV